MTEKTHRDVSEKTSFLKCKTMSVVILLCVVLLVSALYNALTPIYKNSQMVLAIRHNNVEKLRELIQQGADADATIATSDEQSFWHELYECVIRRNESTKPKYYAIQMAIGLDRNLEPIPEHHLSTSIVSALLNGGANPNVADRYSVPIVVYIVVDDSISEDERVQCVHNLLDKGADINAESRNERSLLYCAIANSDLRLCHLLADKGAKCQARHEDISAISIAKHYECSTTLIRLLQQYGYK
ncbi:MAG: hypothetical protein JWL77_3243 [Chthonomonadaceae bacterium]|nr:hypothetical protein [Chthonomonadaceae bacterium]